MTNNAVIDKKLPVIIVYCMALLMTIAGCGGGGGGGSSVVRPDSSSAAVTPVPPAPPQTNVDPQSFRTSEFNRSYNLGAIGAEYAYAAGLTGDGVIIGVLDFNFDFSSGELKYASGSTGINQTYINIYEAQTGSKAPKNPHGHAVAVLAAGLRNTIDTHGVAYDSNVLAVDFFSGVNIEKVQIGTITYHVSNPYTYMIERGARIINISIGYDEDDIISNPPPVSERYVLDNPLFAIARGAILVAAAGNSGDADPMLSNLDIMDDAVDKGLLNSGPGAFIIVGSVDEKNLISDFSDRAGRAQSIFLVAPGERVIFPYRDEDGPGLFIGDGTSFAAPQVSGAAAILRQRWPQLTGQAIANILFDTATDLGAPGTDAVYGRGLLNVRAAVAPVGVITTTLTDNSGYAPLNLTGMVIGPAFGDARPYPFDHVMGLDAFGRDYYFDLRPLVIDQSSRDPHLVATMSSYRNSRIASTTVGSAAATFYVVETDAPISDIEFPLLYREAGREDIELRAFMLQGSTMGWKWQFGRGLSLAALLDSDSLYYDRPNKLALLQHGFLVSDGTFATASYNLNSNTQFTIGIDLDATEGVSWHPNPVMRERQQRMISAVQLNHEFQNALLGIQLGAILEKETVLGSRGTGGFSIGEGASTGFLSINGYYQLSSTISIEGRIESGLTSVTGNEKLSYFHPVGDIFSTAWSFQLQGRNQVIGNSNWIFAISQPLRVENPSVNAKVATRVNPASSLPEFETKIFSLTPSGREVAVEAVWSYYQPDWTIQAALVNRFDAGHIAGRIDRYGMFWLKANF